MPLSRLNECFSLNAVNRAALVHVVCLYHLFISIILWRRISLKIGYWRLSNGVSTKESLSLLVLLFPFLLNPFIRFFTMISGYLISHSARPPSYDRLPVFLFTLRRLDNMNRRTFSGRGVGAESRGFRAIYRFSY